MTPQQTSEVFHQQNYVVIKEVISKDICALLADYANFKANLKPNIRKDDALAGTHREYGDPLMETLLLKLTTVIENATGLKLWPTLSFYYTYQNGTRLAPHKDRSSCQIVAGLCIGADENYKNQQGSWPLMIKQQNKTETITLDYGDIVIFKGHQLEHWRETFTGKWFVSAIFAYVEKEGPLCFQKFDQRKALGRPHVGMFRWHYGCIKNALREKLNRLFNTHPTSKNEV